MSLRGGGRRLSVRAVKGADVSIPELNIVTARGARLETNRARDHEGRGFRFGLADAFRGGAAAFSAMEQSCASS